MLEADYHDLCVALDITMQTHDEECGLVQYIDTGLFELVDVPRARRSKKSFWNLEERLNLHNTLCSYAHRDHPDRPCFPPLQQQRPVIERPEPDMRIDFSLLERMDEELTFDEQLSKRHLPFVHLASSFIRPNWQLLDVHRGLTAYNMGVFLVTVENQGVIEHDVYRSSANFYQLVRCNVPPDYQWSQR